MWVGIKNYPHTNELELEIKDVEISVYFNKKK